VEATRARKRGSKREKKKRGEGGVEREEKRKRASTFSAKGLTLDEKRKKRNRNVRLSRSHRRAPLSHSFPPFDRSPSAWRLESTSKSPAPSTCIESKDRALGPPFPFKRSKRQLGF